VYGTPEALAAAVARLDGRHIAFEVARELGRQVPELPELRDEVARLEAELVAARSALDRVRECLPAIQHALEKLPATCRYHDDTTPHGSWREACCDTGIAPRRRQLAEQALAALTS
jgi:septal ring factor EnvC (AmiA/AmiB activator)